MYKLKHEVERAMGTSIIEGQIAGRMNNEKEKETELWNSINPKL